MLVVSELMRYAFFSGMPFCFFSATPFVAPSAASAHYGSSSPCVSSCSHDSSSVAVAGVVSVFVVASSAAFSSICSYSESDAAIAYVGSLLSTP